jgi:hypothetical protein
MPRAETGSDVKFSTSTSFLLQETASDVKYSSSTPLLLRQGNNSFAVERWLYESRKQGPWNGLFIEETIKPGELRALAKKVYTALGAV